MENRLYSFLNMERNFRGVEFIRNSCFYHQIFHHISDEVSKPPFGFYTSLYIENNNYARVIAAIGFFLSKTPRQT